MEIRPQPAGLAQITRGREGRLIEVDDDVQNVVNDLHEIDPHLRVRYSEAGGYFVVYYKPDDEEEGNGHLVLTAQELDQRIVTRIREIASPNYDYVAELERVERQQAKERDWEWSEWAGELGEKLAFAMRKDRGYDKARVFVPEEIDAGSE